MQRGGRSVVSPRHARRKRGSIAAGESTSVPADFDVAPLVGIPAELGGGLGAVGFDVDDDVLDGVGGLAVELGGGLVGVAEVGADVDVRVIDDLGRAVAAQAFLQAKQIGGVQVVRGAGIARMPGRVLCVQAVLNGRAGRGALGGGGLARTPH